MAEDFDNHRRIFNPCPERVEGAPMIFKAPLQLGQCSMSMSKTRLSSLAQLMRGRFSLGRDVIGWWLGARSAGAGTILLRNLALGASTPWARSRLFEFVGGR